MQLGQARGGGTSVAGSAVMTCHTEQITRTSGVYRPPPTFRVWGTARRVHLLLSPHHSPPLEQVPVPAPVTTWRPGKGTHLPEAELGFELQESLWSMVAHCFRNIIASLTPSCPSGLGRDFGQGPPWPKEVNVVHGFGTFQVTLVI